jgi:uncharacterized protein (DUF1697 family)
MNAYVILLRAVNITGQNRVSMAELRAALTEAGLHDVQTYIQSGNVVARSPLDQGAIQDMVHRVIAEKTGLDIGVIARTSRQIKAILAGNPFPADAAPRIYFTLLEPTPAPRLVDELRQLDFAPDVFEIAGSTIYTLYATRYSKSKVNNNFYERKLKVAATTRNLNTLTRLLEMSALLDPPDALS